jgi:hypothetical protein
MTNKVSKKMRTSQTRITRSKKSRSPGIRYIAGSKICHLPGIGAYAGSKYWVRLFVNNCLSII